MASTTKRGAKKSNAKSRGALVKKSQPKEAPSIQSLRRALDESLEREAATSDILGMIASSPTHFQPVLDAIAERAAKLCKAEDAAIFRVDGNFYRRVAHFGMVPMATGLGESRVIDRDTPPARAMADRQTIHVPDLQTAGAEFPGAKTRGIAMGVRTVLSTPLLREGIAIGAIHIRRREVCPFSDSQIKLLETFADQAVIAIENARLIHEQQVRNRELAEALEQQTATSEILGVIASSPTDLQPVLDTIAENAARVCGSYDAMIRLVQGNSLHVVAHHGPVPPAILDRPIDRASANGRAVIDRQIVHVEDLLALAETEFPGARADQERLGLRTLLIVPLMREDSAIGAISIRRTEVRPFSEKQIALLKTFADQAVIAIENVRLFKEIQERNAELREALEHQTATAEVLGIISRSPTDVQPVLDAIVESAARVCGIDDVVLRLREGDNMVPRAHFGPIPTVRVEISIDEPRQRWINEHGTLHVPDVREQNDTQIMDFSTGGRWRTLLAAPLRRHGELIGTLGARRIEVRPFTPAQIKLLETFADQAVIAIENVRLFRELGERNAELREALEHQTATAEVLGIISRSPTDVQPVLNAIVESAGRVCGIDDVVLRLREGNTMVQRAHFGPIPVPMSRVEISIDETHFRWMREHGALHIPDIRAQNDFSTVGSAGDLRTLLAVPLRQQGELIGTLYARRTEVRPFTPAQIKLLETFADQAVIAIENVRLFNELQGVVGTTDRDE